MISSMVGVASFFDAVVLAGLDAAGAAAAAAPVEGGSLFFAIVSYRLLSR